MGSQGWGSRKGASWLLLKTAGKPPPPQDPYSQELRGHGEEPLNTRAWDPNHLSSGTSSILESRGLWPPGEQPGPGRRRSPGNPAGKAWHAENVGPWARHINPGIHRKRRHGLAGPPWVCRRLSDSQIHPKATEGTPVSERQGSMEGLCTTARVREQTGCLTG